jgi:exodeoxyribonuclease V alpha subunit
MLPVMVTGNNYELGLFNGDTAVLMEDVPEGRLAAFFSAPEGGLRRLSPLRLPAFEPAFALTVHKSQGSEFEQLLLILPERISEALSRELLYTAVTRARSRVEIWGSEEVFLRAVERRIERSSGLRDRLWG